MDFSDLTHEEFNLHNPAYCGFLIYSAVRGYSSIDKNGINPALLYLCLPIILTKSISSRFPKTSKTSLIAWLVANEDCFLSFHKKVTSYFEITHGALDFVYEKGLLTITKDHYIVANNSKLAQSPSLFSKSDTMKKQLSSSKLLGRWLANSPDATTIFSVLGIKP